MFPIVHGLLDPEIVSWTPGTFIQYGVVNSPDWVTYNPIRHSLLFTNFSSNDISEIDLTTLSVVPVANLNFWLSAEDGDPKMVYHNGYIWGPVRKISAPVGTTIIKFDADTYEKVDEFTVDFYTSFNRYGAITGYGDNLFVRCADPDTGDTAIHKINITTKAKIASVIDTSDDQGDSFIVINNKLHFASGDGLSVNENPLYDLDLNPIPYSSFEGPEWELPFPRGGQINYKINNLSTNPRITYGATTGTANEPFGKYYLPKKVVD